MKWNKLSDLWYYLFIYCVWRQGLVCVPYLGYRHQRTTSNSVLSTMWVLGNWTQVFRFNKKHPYPLIQMGYFILYELSSLIWASTWNFYANIVFYKNIFFHVYILSWNTSLIVPLQSYSLLAISKFPTSVLWISTKLHDFMDCISSCLSA